MLVQVDGWSGSGKSVLMYLLDGHPEIYSHPFHDVLQFLFRESEWDEEWVQHKDIWELRVRLARNTHYYKSESFIRQKKYIVEYKSGVQIPFPINLDFSSIDREFMDELGKIETWTPENILGAIYHGYSKEVGKVRRNYAFMGGWKGLNNVGAFNRLYPDGKRVVVKRNICDIVAIQAGRQPLEIEFRSKIHAVRDVECVINSGEIESCRKFYDELNVLAERCPDKILVVEFDDLINNQSATLGKVCEFMGVEVLENMRSSFLGNNIVHDGVDYAAQILDDYRDLLTEKEIRSINEIYSR